MKTILFSLLLFAACSLTTDVPNVTGTWYYSSYTLTINGDNSASLKGPFNAGNPCVAMSRESRGDSLFLMFGIRKDLAPVTYALRVYPDSLIGLADGKHVAFGRGKP